MSVLPPRKIELRFYRNVEGHEPVREWLKRLDEPERRTIGLDLMRVQWRWPVGMPLCRSMGDGLWEVRTNLPNNRIARVLFFPRDGCLHALHAFIKKTPKTPARDLALAKRRQTEIE